MKENKERADTERKNKGVIVTFRVFQSMFYGMSALGLSLMVGDLNDFAKLPFSKFAIVCTIFGFIGAVLSGMFAVQAEKW